MERRDAVPFDPHHFEKLARSGITSSAEETFRDIYQRHHWRGSSSPSGAGAGQDQTGELKRALPRLLRESGVKTLLDLPCGDYSWMRSVGLGTITYIGADLLPELIAPLQAVQADARHQFVVADLTKDPLPPADLLLCRDCLVHLSFADIGRALANIRRSGIPLLLTTTFTGCETNQDIVTGDWRPLNLERAPFSFPPPLTLLAEGCTESDGLFGDKSLGLWEIPSLPGG
jgi:hypothetical protein